MPKDTEFLNQLRTQTEQNMQDLTNLEKLQKRIAEDYQKQKKRIREEIKFLKTTVANSNKFLVSQGQKAVGDKASDSH